MNLRYKDHFIDFYSYPKKKKKKLKLQITLIIAYNGCPYVSFSINETNIFTRIFAWF